MATFFYVTSRTRNVDDALAYVHRVANRFGTKKAALAVARDTLRLDPDQIDVWYRTSTGGNRQVVKAGVVL